MERNPSYSAISDFAFRYTLICTLCCAFLMVTPVKVHADTVRLVTTSYTPHYGPNLVEQGPAVEIVRKALAESGYQLEIDYMPFARALHEAERGKYAGVLGVWYVEERNRQFIYSQPLYQNHLVLFARKADRIRFDHYRELEERQLVFGKVIGYDQPQGIKNLDLATQLTSSDRQLFEMLLAGRTDMVAADVANGLYQLVELFPDRAHEIEWLRPPAELRPLYVIFSRAHPQAESFRQALDNGLAELRARDEVEAILDKHMGGLASDIVFVLSEHGGGN